MMKTSESYLRSAPPGYRLLVPVAIVFVACLLISNIAAQKMINLGGFTFTAGILLFPVTYIFGDVLTECYGYSKARLVIWSGFAVSLLLAGFMGLAVWLEPATGWEHQEAFETVFSFVPRTVIASIIAYAAGEFLNSYVLARLKIMTGGRHLWLRTISSTVFGQAADTVIFLVVAFGGVLPTSLLISAAWSGYLFKVFYEMLATPVTYWIVGKIKKVEEVDVFDRETNFSPFALK